MPAPHSVAAGIVGKVKMRLIVDCEQLYNCSSSLLTEARRLENCMDRLETLIASLKGDWQGAAEVALETRLLEAKSAYLVVICSVEEFAMILNSVAERYDAYDKEVAKKIRHG